jgi:Kef-type K+ transport system membrane component KefB
MFIPDKQPPHSMDFLLEILVILVVAKLFGELLEQGGYPAMIGEIGAGILLGPSVLNLITPSPTLDLFADIGIVALLFISGIEMNLRSFIESRDVAVVTASTGVAVPFLFGFLFGQLFGMTNIESLFIAITLSITSIGVSVRTLIDLKILNTGVGATIVSAAVLDDIVGILLLALLSSIAATGSAATETLLYTVLASIIFLVVIATAGRRAMVWVFDRARRTETHEMVYSVAIVIALLSGYLAHAAGLHYSIGAFIAGLILGGQIREDHMLFDSLMDFGFGFFITIFFASVGLLFDFSLETFTSPLILPILILAFAGKIAGGFFGSIHFLDRAEALMVGIGLSPRGEITLVVAKVALAGGIIASGLYSSVMIMVIATIILTPLLMKRGFSFFESRKEGVTGPPSR